ncbi:MAG: hypothetical protein JO062_24270 [Bryobacterales bacterium]|nr:hypothetical protein [Bryobacterales bacterium]
MRQRPAAQHWLSLLERSLAPGPELLGNSNDRVPEHIFLDRPSLGSLALIVPQDLRWWSGKDFHGRRQFRAVFRFNGNFYDLAITDGDFVNRLRNLPEGIHPFSAAQIPAASRVYLLISLGEPLNGLCYKLVASIIVQP